MRVIASRSLGALAAICTVSAVSAAPLAPVEGCLWDAKSPAPIGRVEGPSVVVDGKVYVFGGFYHPALDAHAWSTNIVYGK